MGLKTYKPTSPGRRGMSGPSFEEITKVEPEKALILPRKRKSGRSHGKIAVRHRGGGAKRMLRIIDFKRDKIGITGRVAAIEYDPNRTARIALVYYADGEKRYILSPLGLNVGDVVKSGEDAEIKPGNSLPMKLIPGGTQIHNIELIRGRGGQLVRGAGTAAIVMVKEGKHVLIRLPSGETRRIHGDCYATVGQVGNVEHQNIKWGKAGRIRLKGRRPTVRGEAMTPRDHPHGGGQGKCPRGFPGPKTKWGKPAYGYKTRKPKASDKLIIKRRK